MSSCIHSFNGNTNTILRFGENGLSIEGGKTVKIDGMTVTGNVTTDISLEAIHTTVEKYIHAGCDIVLISCKCDEKISAGGSITGALITAPDLVAGGEITIDRSTITNHIVAGGSITTGGCELGTLRSEGSVNVDLCISIQSISAKKGVTINWSTIQGNVTAGESVTMSCSQIKGTMSCSSNNLEIVESKIDTIDLKTPMPFGANFLDNNTRRYNLRSQRQPRTEQKQVIKLRDCLVKNIIFESRNGEVILSGDSRVTGSVTGGIII